MSKENLRFGDTRLKPPPVIRWCVYIGSEPTAVRKTYEDANAFATINESKAIAIKQIEIREVKP